MNKIIGLFALNTGLGIINGNEGHVGAFFGILVNLDILGGLGNNTGNIGLAGAMFVAAAEASNNGDSG